jgi:hypothetical protein
MGLEHHDVLIAAFKSIGEREAEALGWVALDTKFERFVTAAIAVEINRNAPNKKRLAHIEFSSGKKRAPEGSKESRVDLVILKDPIASRPGRCLRGSPAAVAMKYETKAGQLFDFAPDAETDEEYLGVGLDKDMRGMKLGYGAGLFFISEIEDGTRCAKYFAGHTTTFAAAVEILKGNINGTFVKSEPLKCGKIDGTDVTIHMCVFDPQT